jgi:hypothetical protein
LDNPAVTASTRTPVVVGVCLFLLLIFSTVTVFVRDAWALQSFQIGVFALLAVYLLVGIRRAKEHMAGGLAPWFVYLIPIWGLVQILAHITASSFETREAVLRWGALAGVFFLSQIAGYTRTARRNLLSAFLLFATGMAVLCLTQLFTSEGRVLWIFPTGYPNVYATFQYYNNYSQFVELALPIALWRALREGWRSWWYALAGGILYASVIGSASRAGTVLCTVELLAMLAIGLVKLRDPETGLPTRSTTAMLVMVPVLAAAFTLAVGWERVWLRFQQNDRLWPGDIPGGLPAIRYQGFSVLRQPCPQRLGGVCRRWWDSFSAVGVDPICRWRSRGRSESMGAGADRSHAACMRGLPISAPRGLGLDVCHARTSLYDANVGRKQPADSKAGHPRWRIQLGL